MNESIKKKIMAKKHACKSFSANKKNYDAYLKLQTINRIVKNDTEKKRGLLLCTL